MADRTAGPGTRPTDPIVEEGEATEPLWEALAGFQAEATGPLTFTANLRPSSVAGFLSLLDPERWSAQAHAGNGIVRAHAKGEVELETLAPEIDRLRAEAVRDGGNLVLPRCPVEWKDRLKVWGDPRPDWDIAVKIKQALDPGAILNPGRFVATI